MKTSETINHQRGSYSVQFVELGELFSGFSKESAYLITDQNVATKIQIPAELKVLTLPPGETTKSLEFYSLCLDWLSKNGANRKSTIIALGGGVIGDLAGFAAATYMRGVALVMIPTSLLAMVDSSVGGKVGIDTEFGKNLVGSFWPPKEVRICPQVLESLPKRHLRNGLAEVLKYGFIMVPGLLQSLQKWIKDGDYASVAAACIHCKAQVVQEDEFETSGRRAILNFGHTVGHAIESHLHYQDLLHGEAISIGMVVECYLAEKLGTCSAETFNVVQQTLQSHGLPIWHPALANSEGLIKLMKQDKKADHTINMSLIGDIGVCKLVRGIPEDLIKASLFEINKKNAS